MDEVSKIVRDKKKNDKVARLECLEILSNSLSVAAEYLDRAAEAALDKSRPLNGEGILEIVQLRDRVQMYSDATKEVIGLIKGGKL